MTNKALKGGSELREALELAAERAAAYVTTIGGRSVSPAVEAVAQLRRLHESMPEGPTDARSVVAMLDEIGSPATVATQGGRYFGFVIGGSLPAVTAASG